VLVPGYHAQSRVNNNVCHGFTMLSDDGGRTFRLGATAFGAGDKHSNECQAVQLRNGSVLINARSLANPLEHQRRIQTISHDHGACPDEKNKEGGHGPPPGRRAPLAKRAKGGLGTRATRVW
jgi:hypothetical protein